MWLLTFWKYRWGDFLHVKYLYHLYLIYTINIIYISYSYLSIYNHLYLYHLSLYLYLYLIYLYLIYISTSTSYLYLSIFISNLYIYIIYIYTHTFWYRDPTGSQVNKTLFFLHVPEVWNPFHVSPWISTQAALMVKVNCRKRCSPDVNTGLCQSHL